MQDFHAHHSEVVWPDPELEGELITHLILNVIRHNHTTIILIITYAHKNKDYKGYQRTRYDTDHFHFKDDKKK